MRFRFGECAVRFLIIFAGVAIAGCGGGVQGPKTIPASGKVTYKGEAVKSGSLTFSPSDGKTTRAAQAQIIDGHYKTNPGQGLMAGDYKVIVQALNQSIAEFEANKGSKKPGELFAVPKKYTDLKTTDLSVKVADKDSAVSKDFELKD